MKFSGKLKSNSIKDFSGYFVHAEFQQLVKIDDNANDSFVSFAMRRGLVEKNGSFEFEMPDAADRVGPTLLRGFGRDGVEVGTSAVENNSDGQNLELDVDAHDPVTVNESELAGLGAEIRIRGRVIDRTGTPASPSTFLILRGKPKGSNDFVPLDFASTSSNGYFSMSWTDKKLSEASISVGGMAPEPLELAEDLLPQRLIVVVEELPKEEPDDEECECEDGVPRVPDATDLAENSSDYSADIGGCVDFTIPNRTLEEVVYQAVVRTTQPELNPPDPQPRPTIPPDVIKKFAELANLRPREFKLSQSLDRRDDNNRSEPASAGPGAFATTALTTLGGVSPMLSTSMKTALKPAVENAAVLAPGIDLNGVFRSDLAPGRRDVADVVLENRRASNVSIDIDSDVLAEMVADNRPVNAKTLLTAEQRSVVRKVRNGLRKLDKSGAGRFSLSEERQLNWDQVPDRYQATTIAHGHLLSIKQVWKSDGYSLGDLLYSLPLAPGQQKLISVLDWDRREVSARRASRSLTEELRADLSRDRDISDIIRSTLSERMTARSQAKTKSISASIGGFIGPVVFGASGGASSASSTASQTSARRVSGVALNRLTDRTAQSASAVRSQRSTVVQTARQGESVSAQTEVVANYNHCHAVTIEYFEVLRHLQVSSELAKVQECLFVPFSIAAFNKEKAIRWRDVLEDALMERSLLSAFNACERVLNNWESADFPMARYADDAIRHLDCELRMIINLPKPADDDVDDFVESNWKAYEDSGLLGTGSASDLWEKFFGGINPSRRQRVWDSRIAPAIAQRLVAKLGVTLHLSNGTPESIPVDPTLVSNYRENRSLLVTLRPRGPVPSVARAMIDEVEIYFRGAATLPPGAEVRVNSATMNYRTDFYQGTLFRDRRVLNDLSLRNSGNDTVRIPTPLTRMEKRNPRDRDRRRSEKLVGHLNEYVEYYHRAIWIEMDPNRRFMLLDGYEAPNANGRSVASVVENQVVGIVGNSLVMPVAPGQKLDPTYEFSDSTLDDLKHHYAIDEKPRMRISLPTAGVFAEAVMGKCNSCEEKDDTKFWRFEEEPIPDTPTPIGALSTDSRRRTPASVKADKFAKGIVGYQELPKAVDPTGLASAMTAIGTSNIFKDLTGLAQNQANAGAAFKATMKVAQEFAAHGASLAQQRYQSRKLDENLDVIKKAKERGLTDDETTQSLTEGLFRRAIGERDDGSESATKGSTAGDVVKRVTKSKKGSLRINKPSGTVELDVENTGASGGIDVHIDPPLSPVKQKTGLVCWAAGGAMMNMWQLRTTRSVEAFLDELGGDWRTRYDNDIALNVAQFRAFAGAIGLVEEGPQAYTAQGIARLVEHHGPLLAIGDDAVGLDNNLSHVRVISGITGDATMDGTRIMLVDSADGQLRPMTFKTFSQLNEGNDPVDLGTGFFHY